jgi:hypothetical protein
VLLLPTHHSAASSAAVTAAAAAAAAAAAVCSLHHTMVLTIGGTGFLSLAYSALAELSHAMRVPWRQLSMWQYNCRIAALCDKEVHQ